MPRSDATPDDVSRTFEDLGRISLAAHSLQSCLEHVAVLAGRILPATPMATVTVVAEGRPRTVAASEPPAAALDELQAQLGGGPCLTAASSGRPVQVPDTVTEKRWPEFGRRAAEVGCCSIVSTPLPVAGQSLAGLNLYLRGSSAVDDAVRALAAEFAARAVLPVANMHMYATAVDQAQQMRAAMDSRAVIEQAKGILVERHKLTPDVAFQALVAASMRTHAKVREIAEHLVRTGELRTE